MVRLILFGIVVIVAFMIWVGKQAAGAVLGSDRLRQESIQSQTQKTMRSTARGVNWLNEQWEEAKQAAREKSEDPPFLALLIAVPDGDREALEQAKRFFEEYGSRLDAMTRVDSNIDDGSGVRLARICIDISNWPVHAIREAVQELTNCIGDLEHYGQAAFVVRYVDGQNEVLARNGLC